MAGGKYHAKATKRNLLWLLPVSGLVMTVEPTGVGIAVGAIIGHVLTPDIDHHYTTYEEYRVYRYSRLLGFCWWLYWLPYEKLIPHRGISHIPVVGTATRFLYLLWFPLWYTHIPYLFWVFVFVGWCIQDNKHLQLDRGKHHAKKSRIRTHRRYRNH